MNEEKIASAVSIMIQTDRMHKHLLDSKVSKIGLHRTQHRVLMHIARKDKLLSQKSIAEHMGLTPAAITGVLKRLESDGYIKRIVGSDNRYNEVVITDLGKKIVEDSYRLFSEVDASLFDGFTESELDGYISCLQKIQSNIKAREENYNEEVKQIEKMV